MSDKKINPWQWASVKLNDLRFAIEDVLNSFDENQKKTKDYENMMETLDLIMSHALEAGGMRKYKNRKMKKYLFSLSMIAIGAAITKITGIGIDMLFISKGE